jgi:hypothetical protein
MTSSARCLDIWRAFQFRKAFLSLLFLTDPISEATTSDGANFRRRSDNGHFVLNKSEPALSGKAAGTALAAAMEPSLPTKRNISSDASNDISSHFEPTLSNQLRRRACAVQTSAQRAAERIAINVGRSRLPHFIIPQVAQRIMILPEDLLVL